MLLNARVLVVAGSVGLLALFASMSTLFADPDESSHADDTIAALESALAETTDQQSRESLSEKLRMAQEDRERELAARQVPADSRAVEEKQKRNAEEAAAIDSQPPLPDVRQPAGNGFVVDRPSSPFPSRQYVVENNWWAPEGKGIIAAYAGKTGSADGSPGHGVVVVRLESPEKPATPRGGAFLTPENHGAVHVVGASGSVLELEADDGHRFLFNMATLVYE